MEHKYVNRIMKSLIKILKRFYKFEIGINIIFNIYSYKKDKHENIKLNNIC